VSAPARHRESNHPLVEAAQRAASTAAARAQELRVQRARVREGTGTSVADLADAAASLDTARRRGHEARRRLVTQQLAHAHHVVLGQDFLAAARRLARLTLSEDVREQALD
jgi:ribosomal protein L13E